MKNAGKARSYGLYRHLRTSKEIIENLLNYFIKNHMNSKKDQLAGLFFVYIQCLYQIYSHALQL